MANRKEAERVRAIRCKAAIWVRDCLRRTGHGKYGFEMHYKKKQCSRRAHGSFCTQHEKMQAEGANLLMLDWYEFVE
jgi:hypothetical protein